MSKIKRLAMRPIWAILEGVSLIVFGPPTKREPIEWPRMPRRDEPPLWPWEER